MGLRTHLYAVSSLSEDCDSGSEALAEGRLLLVQLKIRRILSQALLPFRVLPILNHGLRQTAFYRGPPTHSFRGLRPLSVFPTSGSDLTHHLPQCWFATSLGLSHPYDALLPLQSIGLISSQFRFQGFALRGLAPCSVPYALSSALSCLLDVIRRPSARLCSPGKSRPHPSGLNLNAATTPIGFIPLRLYHPPTSYNPLRLPSPHALASRQLHAPDSCGAPGYLS
jgi:hypothetical protein